MSVTFESRDSGPRDEEVARLRVPPNSNEAEQSVLGAMMMSKDAISDVVEVLRGVDFYRPNHETIFDAIINLYGRGEPADPITVAGELGKSGQLSKVGGAVYLHDPTAGMHLLAGRGREVEIAPGDSRAILTATIDGPFTTAFSTSEGRAAALGDGGHVA